MRILFCGDRHWNNRAIIRAVIQEMIEQYGPFTLIHGKASGADTLAGFIGKNIFKLEVEEYPANWTEYGKPAGRIRNRQMLVEGKPDLVIAFHNDLAGSKGTGHMMKIAELAYIPRIWYTEEGIQFDER